jgi:hypothetical protein
MTRQRAFTGGPRLQAGKVVPRRVPLPGSPQVTRVRRDGSGVAVGLLQLQPLDGRAAAQGLLALGATEAREPTSSTSATGLTCLRPPRP